MNWKITVVLLLTTLFGYAQEINVRVGSTNYLTGSTYTFATAIPSGNNSTAITFTIQNTQAATVLNLTGNPKIAVTGLDETMFSVNESVTSSSVNGVGTTTFTVTFSPTSVGIKDAMLIIENDDANESTYVINLKGTGLPSKGSSIIATPAYVYTTFIPYMNYQADDITIANSIEVGSFTISDGNGSNDADNLPTTLTNITFALSNSANIRSVALYDDATEVGEDIDGASSITFSDLALVAPDNGTKTFTIRVTYNEVVTDGAIPVFTVTAAGALASESTFTYSHAGTTSANSSRAVTSATSPNNRIDVVATKLEFIQEPSDTDTFLAMAPSITVQAIDALGNRDTGYTAIPVILTTTGSYNTVGSPVNDANNNTSAGLATFPSIVHNAPGTGFTLTATSGSLLPAISTGFDIGPASGASNYFRSRVVSGDWGTPSSWETSHNNVDSWMVSTLVPNNVSRGIQILPGHSITCTTTVIADQIAIEAGGTLILETGANFTLSNGATDLAVRGTFTYNNGSYTQAAGARASFGATGVYNHNIASSTLTFPYAVWNAASTCNITGLNNVTPIVATNMDQSFGILNWNNPNQGAPVIANNDGFKVAGILNIGTTTANTNNIICLNDSGTHVNSIKTLNLNGGKLIASSGTGSNTLNLTGITTIAGGELIASRGSGTVAINASNVFNLSAGKFILIDDANSGNVNFTLAINRNFNLSGTGAFLLENVSSATGVATATLNNNFVSSSLATPAVDFGTGDVTGNVINVRRNFTKTENGTFTTSSSTAAKGFVFTYAGTQTFNYTGTNSSSVSYTVNPGSTLSMSSNLTFDSASGLESIFTVLNGGRINLGARVITGNATQSRVVFEEGSTLSSSNTGGIGGVGALGSFQGFASVDTTPATGRLTLPNDVNYILAGSTTTPFPVGAGIVFGNPATVTTSANITSNMTTPLTVNSAFNVLGYTFKLASGAGNNLILNNAALNVTGIFDNNGENQVVNGGGSPSVTINGRFITRDEQGFVGVNAAIPTISPVLGAASIIEYGRAGTQPVQASPSYANLILSGSGIKTLLGNTAISTKLTVTSPSILEAQTFTAGGASTALTMTGTSQYRISGTGVKPDAGGLYTLTSTSKIEFYGVGNAIEIRLGSPAINYGRIDINGTNISNDSATTGIQFVSSSSVFTVKNGATFKFKNTDGFTGSASTALSNSQSVNPILEAGSTIEYAGADQIITPYNISTNNSYKKVAVSGTGTKTLAIDPILIRDNLAVTSSLLKIEGNKSLTVTNGITTVDNTATEGILVENNGSLVQVTAVDNELTNNNIGEIKVQRTTTPMYRYDFTYWGSPVKDHTVKNLSPMTLFDKFMSWNADTGAWVIIPVGAEAMVPGKGYAVRAPQTFSTNPAVKVPYTGSFTGVPNNGNVTYATYGNGALTPQKFNLLGNPYPSAIDVEKFLLANSTKLEGTIYLWTHNTALDGYSYTNSDYAVYNFSGPTTTYPIGSTGGATKYLAAGQGFYVKGISAGASTVTFTNAMRETSNNNNFFRPAGENTTFDQVETTPEKHRVWLNLRNNEDAFNQTLVGYIENATDGIDWGYDGEQFGGAEVKLYSIVEEKNFTIQGKALPFTSEDEVPLGYQSTIAGALNISIDHYDGLFEYQNVYLEDKSLNIVHNLKESQYEFTSEIGTFDERFVLRFVPSETLSNPDHENIANAVSVYKNNNQITVKSKIENIQDITVYDLLGRQVFNAKNIGSNAFNITDVVLNEQPLIVRATLVNGQIVNKKIVY